MSDVRAVEALLDDVVGTTPHYFLIKDLYELEADMKGQI
jgi:hypothetical protein